MLDVFLNQFSNPWCPIAIALFVALIFREKTHIKLMIKVQQEGQKTTQIFEKSLQDLKDHHQEQIRILREAKNLVWIRVDNESNSSSRQDLQ